ncbi:MAG: hypothetical protein ACK448_04480, partial [Bacteroidota bacterium]
MSPEEIVQRCEAECMSMKIKIPVLLADINTVTGVPNFLRLAKNTKHIIPLVGVEIRNGDELLYTLISKTQSGYAAMNRFLSIYLTTKSDFPQEPPRLEHVYVVGPYQPKSRNKVQPDNCSAIAVEADLLTQWHLQTQGKSNPHSETQPPIPFIAWHTTT